MLTSKYDEAVRLYDSGLSIGDVADFFTVTRQAMWQILKRRGVKFRPMRRSGAANGFYRGGVRADGRAHDILELAVRKGIVVPGPCEVCGTIRRTQAHHDDYAKPLEVRWFCKKHHHQWHERNVAKNAKHPETLE